MPVKWYLVYNVCTVWICKTRGFIWDNPKGILDVVYIDLDMLDCIVDANAFNIVEIRTTLFPYENNTQYFNSIYWAGKSDVTDALFLEFCRHKLVISRNPFVHWQEPKIHNPENISICF